MAAAVVLTGWSAVSVQAEDQSRSAGPAAFVEIASACLDWLDADAPDDDPFKSGSTSVSWEHINTFPAVGPAQPDVAVGAYMMRDGYFRIDMTRRADSALCSGEANGQVSSELRDEVMRWVRREVDTGSLNITDEKLTPRYEMKAQICMGGGGELTVVVSKGVAMKFHAHLDRNPLSKGTCDA